MSMSRNLLTTASFAAAFAVVSASNAALIIGNLTSTSTAGTASGISSNANGSKGVGFKATGSYSLDTLTLRLADDATTSPLSDVIAGVYLRDTTANRVGALVASFIPTASGNLTTSAAEYTFTPTVAGQQITNGTQYWVILTNTTTNTFNWTNSSPTAMPTGDGATSDGAAFGTGTALPSNSGNFNSFRLDGTLVPEPTAAAVALLAATYALARRRR